MKDIISNYGNITYSVTEIGKKMSALLAATKQNEDESFTLNKDNFNKILEYVRILQDKSNFELLGILAKSAVPDNEIKIQILKKLQE